MLAKMWKKVLLGICIIACIFNLMSKLVNRHSLESNLKTANDGNTVLDALKKEDSSETSNIIENENENINNDTEQSENNINTEKSENTNKQNENSSDGSKNKKDEEDIDITDFFNTEEYTKDNNDKVFKYTDYTIVF